MGRVLAIPNVPINYSNFLLSSKYDLKVIQVVKMTLLGGACQPVQWSQVWTRTILACFKICFPPGFILLIHFTLKNTKKCASLIAFMHLVWLPMQSLTTFYFHLLLLLLVFYWYEKWTNNCGGIGYPTNTNLTGRPYNSLVPYTTLVNWASKFTADNDQLFNAIGYKQNAWEKIIPPLIACNVSTYVCACWSEGEDLKQNIPFDIFQITVRILLLCFYVRHIMENPRYLITFHRCHCLCSP